VKLLTKREAAAELRVSRGKLQKLMRERRIRYHKDDQKVWFRQEDLEAYIESLAVEPLERR